MEAKTRKPRFLIVSPHQCGMGPVVLHLLSRILTEFGYDAKVFRLRRDYPYSIPGSRREFLCNYLPFIRKKPKQILDSQEGSVKGCVLTDWPYVDDDTIVVYPEVVFGNPLAAKHVVRWFLNVNLFRGQYTGAQPYGKDDLFICYEDIFNDYQLNPSGRKVTLQYFNYDIYKRWNYGHREGNCFLIRKGRGRTDLPSAVPGIIIDNLSEEEKAEIFNKCEYLYSYDTQTTYIYMAAICGCLPIIIPEPGKKREDYLGKNLKSWGAAYGTSQEEIDFARTTYKEMMKYLKSWDIRNPENVHKFLGYCKEHFQKRMNSEIRW